MNPASDAGRAALAVLEREGSTAGPAPARPWSPPQQERGRSARTTSTTSPWYVPGIALTVGAALLVGLCVQVALLSPVTYARAQQMALAQFRSELARATAPVGQTFIPQAEIQGLGIAGEPVDGVETPGEQLYPLGTPVAALSIEALGIADVVVLEGTTPGVLQQGPGHERNSVLPGQEGWSLLYGRAWSYGGPFGDIDELVPGQKIVVTTGQGEHTYAVTGVRRAGDPLPRREAGQGRLVLGTAQGVPFVPAGVVYVDALLTSPMQPAPARRVLALESSEAIMAGDSSAWYTILLWTQGLMLAVLALSWGRSRWGRAQAWVVGVPLVAVMGIGTAYTVAQLLPNVL